MVQNIIDCRGKNANVIEVQQMGDTLQIPQAMLHQATETRASIW